MIRRPFRAAFGLALALVVMSAPSARARPPCQSETGVRVRSGIFGADLGSNLAAILLPFPVFLAIVAAIHLGPPWSRDRPRPGPGGRPAGPTSKDQP